MFACEFPHSEINKLFMAFCFIHLINFYFNNLVDTQINNFATFLVHAMLLCNAMCTATHSVSFHYVALCDLFYKK